MRKTSERADKESPAIWHWMGHRVLNAVGSAITMPDTEANQAEYPQVSSQKRGGGFLINKAGIRASI